jgi:hypothetical protein
MLPFCMLLVFVFERRGGEIPSSPVQCCSTTIVLYFVDRASWYNSC